MTIPGIFLRDVAVKIKNSDSSVEGSTMQDFVKEAEIMVKLDHHCVVQFIGISTGPPVLVVLELVPLGSMLDFIINNPGLAINSTFFCFLFVKKVPFPFCSSFLYPSFGGILLSPVPPSNSLVSISDP